MLKKRGTDYCGFGSYSMSSVHSSRSMATEGCDADKMLDVYIYDLLKKRNFEESAKAFLKESKLATDSAKVAIDVPDGFLLEWWTVFWDVFKVRSGQQHSGIAATYVQSQQAKSREQHQQRLRMQGQLQGMPDSGLNNSSLARNNVGASPRMGLELRNPGDPFLRQPPILSHRMLAAKKAMQQGRHIISDQSLHIASMDGIGESSASNPATPSNLNPTFAATIRTAGDTKMPADLSSRQLINPGADVSQTRQQMQLIGSPGWPLNPGGLKRQMMSSQGSEHFCQSSAQSPQTQRILSAQMQQQMYLRLPNQSESQRMSMRDGLKSTERDGLPTGVGTGVEFSEGAVSSPSISQGSHDNQEKYLVSPRQQHQLQHSNLTIPQQHQRQQQSRQDRSSGVGGTSLIGRKRKEKSDSSQQLANSLGAMNTTESFNPSLNSDPTFQLTVVSKPQQQKTRIAISMSSPSTTNQTAIASGELDDVIAADIDLPDPSNLPIVQERVSMTTKSVLGDPRSAKSIPAEVNATPKFSFREVSCLRASSSKVLCCHFSADGKLLASAGHDKKVNLWNMTTLKLEQTLEEHLLLITDVRFSPTSTRLATSSVDKTVKVWEIGNPTCSIRTFQGHATSVWALDFHPNNEDLLCSCDGESEIRYWSVSQGTCIKSFKGGVTQLRFQSRLGRFLAAAAGNVVSIFDMDLESETSVYCLLHHSKPVSSLCWSASGDFLVSLTEDYVRVWSIGSSNENGESSKCRYELGCKEKMFQSCVFHPNYPSLLVIGCYQSMELWNMVENKIMTVAAHDGLIVSLMACPITGMVASASYDKCVKLWQ